MVTSKHKPPSAGQAPTPTAVAGEQEGVTTPPSHDATTAVDDNYPIVGIGASAGGLEAFEHFFRACPVDTGMAFVLVPHLDPNHDSLLADILQRATAMPVMQVLDETRPEPNRVYIIPPNREMAILNRVLQLSMPAQVRGQRMPIDGFLRSLAEDQGERAIGVVLSGTATDGTFGLRAILGAGGICMVQEPSTARYSGMPQSAIGAGYATHVLPVELMPAQLMEVASRSAFPYAGAVGAAKKALSGIHQILLQVRSVTGHDFSLYKKSTIGRRIERRMAKHNIDNTAVYARYLKEHPAEVQALFRELLINVTSFFRDPDAFLALKQTVLAPLLAQKPAGQAFRVWVAGCATGEEAYSIAMVLLELLDELRPTIDHEPGIHIYATDLDDEAIAVARAGRYPPNITQDVTPERLRRFFNKDDAGYKIKKEIRDMVVFATQNVVKDPPFTKLDLLSCRNLMIYLEPELQSRLILNFHYALKPDGVLFLSTSENITQHSERFSVVDRKWKLYRAKHTGAAEFQSPFVLRSQSVGLIHPSTPAATLGRSRAGNHASVGELSQQALLHTYAPASVTTDSKGNILFVYGDTGRYLRPAPGPVSNNVIEMAREGLQLELRRAILNASAHAEPTLEREASVKSQADAYRVLLSVRILAGQKTHGEAVAGEPLLLVSFQQVAGTVKGTRKPATRSGRSSAAMAGAARNEELERELAYTRENLQATIEELQATNEELKSTNEELQSTNEELQSTNEELETSKEELQSLNEETITVNGELNARIEQFSGMQNDLKNLLDSTSTGTLFLDNQLAIRRYTPSAVKVYRLIASDVGRPLGDITSNIEGEHLLAELQGVMDSLIPREREVRTRDGAWYLARMQPYRTLDNVIAGVVLTFTDVSDFKLARAKLDAAQQARSLLAEGIINTVSEPLIVLDSGLLVVSANASFYRAFQLTAEASVGRKIFDLGQGQWNIPDLYPLLEDILPRKQVLEGYLVKHALAHLSPGQLRLNARRIVTAAGDTELILLAITGTLPAGTP